MLVDQQATAANIPKALIGLAEKAQPQDTLVVTMSGHGTMIGSLYFFLPHEMKCRPGEPLEEDVRAHGLPMHQLNDWISHVPALKRVLVIDTCHASGAFGLVRTGRSPWQFKKAMELMSRVQGSFILGAAAAGEEAQEVPDLGHGVLTYTLLASLGEAERIMTGFRPLQPAAEEELLTVRNWFAFAQDHVPTLTKLFFNRAHFVNYEACGQDFPILPLRSGSLARSGFRREARHLQAIKHVRHTKKGWKVTHHPTFWPCHRPSALAPRPPADCETENRCCQNCCQNRAFAGHLQAQATSRNPGKTGN